MKTLKKYELETNVKLKPVDRFRDGKSAGWYVDVKHNSGIRKHILYFYKERYRNDGRYYKNNDPLNWSVAFFHSCISIFEDYLHKKDYLLKELFNGPKNDY